MGPSSWILVALLAVSTSPGDAWTTLRMPSKATLRRTLQKLRFSEGPQSNQPPVHVVVDSTKTSDAMGSVKSGPLHMRQSTAITVAASTAIAAGLVHGGFGVHQGMLPDQSGPPAPLHDTIQNVLAVAHAKSPGPLLNSLQTQFHHSLQTQLHGVGVSLHGAVAGYERALEEHYAVTTALQAFVLVSVGDVGAQLIEMRQARGVEEDTTTEIAGSDASLAVGLEGPELVPTQVEEDAQRYDLVRTLRMGLLGTLIGGVGTSNWLRFLEGQIPGHASFATVVEKATIDACVWAPVANGGYLVGAPLLEGKSVSEVKGLVEAEFTNVMKTELLTFFPYNLVSFSLIPPLLRPFSTGFISMCFSLYISIVAHSTGRSSTTEDATAAAGGSDL